MKNADWIIDLGPCSGPNRGQVAVDGKPDEVVRGQASFTGQSCKKVLCP